jgi:hypothetical protein
MDLQNHARFIINFIPNLKTEMHARTYRQNLIDVDISNSIELIKRVNRVERGDPIKDYLVKNGFQEEKSGHIE